MDEHFIERGSKKGTGQGLSRWELLRTCYRLVNHLADRELMQTVLREAVEYGLPEFIRELQAIHEEEISLLLSFPQEIDALRECRRLAALGGFSRLVAVITGELTEQLLIQQAIREIFTD